MNIQQMASSKEKKKDKQRNCDVIFAVKRDLSPVQAEREKKSYNNNFQLKIKPGKQNLNLRSIKL